ncbi:hypothetical protein EW146_g4509 [Bondarzewia mesenterica]|uniref:Autophagy-related protein 13 n=1 Tax=Bondarzewia mesenterica TaxID=1095465 RepID=A0A4S4LWI2_9AGAM|nr:hypothetical protein EW146_g4509 [Bondarzewia mesenterica]
MSNDTQKSDQIAHRYYTKLALVVNNARATAEPKAQAKPDKWFNLEIPDTDIFREHLRIYRSISTLSTPPPFHLRVLLSIPELTTNQVLVHHSPDSPRLRIEPTPKFILLESWSLTFSAQHRQPGDTDLAPPTIYKHGIGLFRSLYTLLRVLPAWKLHRRLRRRAGTGGAVRNGNLSIQLHVSSGNRDEEGVLWFDTPPAANIAPLPNESHAFPPIPHPMGTLSLSVQYLTSPHFQLDELESLLSSRFFSLDEGTGFIPTLVKNQQRDSLSSSPGSLPIRTSLPASPPSTSVAERMMRQPSSHMHSRTTSFSGMGAIAMSRQVSGAEQGAAGSSASIASREEGHPISALTAARVRKESTGSSRGADLPSSPGALPIRRPVLNPLNPFKSSTLSSGSPSLHSPSPSLRQSSPLSAALPSRPTHTSPASSRVPPSPIGIGMSKISSSPVTPLRPSPPMQPGSLGDRRSLASNEGGSLTGETRKRYSSSFGHRYKDSGGAASEGSAGSVDRKDGEKVGSTSFLSANADEEDLSAFMNDTTQPKPLNRHYRDQSGDSTASRFDGGQAHDRERTATEVKSAGGSPNVRPGAMLTTAAAVDEKLRRMNEAFEATMQAFGGRGRGRERERTRSDVGYRERGARMTDSPMQRANRISEVTETSAGSAGASLRSERTGSTSARTGDGIVDEGGLLMLRPRPVSRADSIAEEEVLGRLDFDDDRRRSMGQ